MQKPTVNQYGATPSAILLSGRVVRITTFCEPLGTQMDINGGSMPLCSHDRAVHLVRVVQK